MVNWYIDNGKKIQGPFAVKRLQRYVDEGRLRPGMKLSQDRVLWLALNAVDFLTVGDQSLPKSSLLPGDSGVRDSVKEVSGGSARQAETSKSMPLLRKGLTCPHCLESVQFADMLWVSQHEQLRGDPVLGADAYCRFLPSRFNAKGKAIDAFGFECDRMACPKCRLELDHALTRSKAAIFSIIGAPSSGKSYFLGAMTWQLRTLLPSQFKLTFSDIDPVSNRILNQYEEKLFLQEDEGQLVALPKTTTTGDLYRTIQVGEQPITLPRPFLFSLRSQPDSAGDVTINSIVLYDNAGEHFYPGQESLMSRGTKHLGRSSVLFFLFDPLQDVRFRKGCRRMSEDPQLERPVVSEVRQETILLEAISRIRRQLGLGLEQRHRQPLIIVATKYDVWGGLLGCDLENPWTPAENGQPAQIRRDEVEAVSDKLRSLFQETTPELVSAAESFSEQVRYIPISALGTSPVDDPQIGLSVRAGSLDPVWVTVPLLYSLSKWSHMIPSKAPGGQA